MVSSPELDWYDILGVDPAASDAEVGRAFRALARRYHPDSGPDPSHTRFSDIARAWEVLGDPSSRADYDRRRRGASAGGIHIPVRRWTTSPRQGPAVDPSLTDNDDEPDQPDVEVSVSFSEAIRGTVAKVALPRAVICADCSGTGRVSSGPCTTCGGQGRHQRQSGSITINHVCSECGGSGARPPATCPACAGRGWRQSTRDLSVRVPAGVAEGTRLRLRSPSTKRPAGFARVRIRPDPWYSRQGSDIVLRLPLSLPEAALGCTVAVELPDGPAEIVVPPRTRAGDRIRLPLRGVPGTQRGDLLLAVEIVVPDNPTPQQREALETLRAVSPDPREGWPAARMPSSDGQAGPDEAKRFDGDSSQGEQTEF